MGNTNINLNEELKKKAKQTGLNISALTEHAIKEKLGEKKVKPNETLKCQFCGRRGYRETAEEALLEFQKNEPNALTWLWPDEKWICNSCLRRKMLSVAAAKA